MEELRIPFDLVDIHILAFRRPTHLSLGIMRRIQKTNKYKLIHNDKIHLDTRQNSRLRKHIYTLRSFWEKTKWTSWFFTCNAEQQLPFHVPITGI